MQHIVVKTHLKLAKCLFQGSKSTLKCLFGQFLAYNAILPPWHHQTWYLRSKGLFPHPNEYFVSQFILPTELKSGENALK